MKYMITAVLTVAVVLGLAASSAEANDRHKPGAVGGSVVDRAGNPVAGAHVVLSHNGRTVREGRTDRAGHFKFERVRPGHYVVKAAKRGVGRDRERVRVRSGEATRVRLQLHKR